MAIVVLVMWLFTAGAGFSLLVSSGLGRTRPSETAPAGAAAAGAAAAAEAQTAAAEAAPAAEAALVAQGASATRERAGAAAMAAGKREARRAARARFDTPSLVAARNAPMVPGLRSLLEFAHPACGIAGLAFWLGFTLVHNRTLGLIAFGLVAVTAAAGLGWFTANARAARRGGRAGSFPGRLVVLHGAAAAVTVTLAALTALAVLT